MPVVLAGAAHWGTFGVADQTHSGRIWVDRCGSGHREHGVGDLSRRDVRARVGRCPQLVIPTVRDGPRPWFALAHATESRDILATVAAVSLTRSYAAAVINERLTELGVTLSPVALQPAKTSAAGPPPSARHRSTGRQTGTVFGMAELPCDIAVEIEMISRVRD